MMWSCLRAGARLFLVAVIVFASFLKAQPAAPLHSWPDVIAAKPAGCIKTTEELEPLLRNTSFYQDLQLHRSRGLNRTHLWQLVQRNSGIGRRNESLAIRSGRLVLVRNQSLFSPFLVPSERPLNGRILWTLSFLSEAIRHGIALPDALFYVEEDDSCVSCSEWFNPVPAITWFRHQPTFRRLPSVDGDINHLFLLAPTTDDVDHRLYNYPWENKTDQIFFRGGAGCHPPEHIRERLDKEFPDMTDVDNCARAFFFTPKLYKPFRDLADCKEVSGQGDKDALRTTYEPKFVDPNFLTIRNHARYKYLLALDGFTVSHRFSKLLHTDSVVLKETSGWEEYFYAALKPWVHYVPVLNESIFDPFYLIGNFSNAEGQQQLREIARNGQAFAGKFLCRRARALYWLRLLHEYRDLFRGGEEMDAFIRELEASRAGNMSSRRFEQRAADDTAP